MRPSSSAVAPILVRCNLGDALDTKAHVTPTNKDNNARTFMMLLTDDDMCWKCWFNDIYVCVYAGRTESQVQRWRDVVVVARRRYNVMFLFWGVKIASHGGSSRTYSWSTNRRYVRSHDVMVIISECRPPNGHSADFLMTAMDDGCVKSDWFW